MPAISLPDVRRATSSAFEALYRQHAPRIYTLACRMAGSPEDGEDLLQEIFLQAYRKLGSFKGDSALGTWLYRLALNHCLDYVRSRQAKMNKLTETLDAETSFEPTARRETPIARLDLERAHRAAAGRLPRGVRAARRRRVRSQGSRRGCSGIAEGTSKSQVFKARMKLRALLGKTVDASERTAINEYVDGTLDPAERAERRAAPRRRARRAGSWSTTCARSRARPARSNRASRRCASGRGSSARSSWNGARASVRARRRAARRGSGGRVGDSRRLALRAVARRRGRARARDRRRPALRARRATRADAAPAPARRRSGGDAAQSVEIGAAAGREHYEKAIKGLEQIANAEQGALDPRTAATLQKNLAVIDQAISESRAAVRVAAGERAGAAEPDRELQGEDRAAAGHGGADQRNAQRQRGRGGADRLRAQAKGQLTCDSQLPFVMPASSLAAVPAAAQDRRRSGSSLRDVVAHASRRAPTRAATAAGTDRALLAQGEDRARRPRQHRQHLRRHRRHRRVGRRGVDRGGEADARRPERAGARADRRRRARRARRRADRARATARPQRRGDRVSVDYTVDGAGDGVASTCIRSPGRSRSPACTGRCARETVSGNVTTTDTPRLENAKSVSGDVTLTGAAADGDSTAGSVSGNVTREGAEGARAGSRLGQRRRHPDRRRVRAARRSSRSAATSSTPARIAQERPVRDQRRTRERCG